MKINTKDRYLGAALAQIVEYDVFKSLNKASDKYGHYKVNDCSRILMKYSASSNKSKKPAGFKYSFSFSKDDLKILRDDSTIFLALICIDKIDSICVLTKQEMSEALALLSKKPSTSIQVTIPKKDGSRMIVSGLDNKIPHNAFPKAIFENATLDQKIFVKPLTPAPNVKQQENTSVRRVRG